MKSIKSSQVLITVGVLVIAIAGFFFFKVFQAIPSAVPISKVLSEPKTIGVMYVRQTAGVVTGLKEGLKELGYTNITYKEVLLEQTATVQDVEKLTKELVGEKVDLLYTTGELRALGAINGTKAIGSDTPIVFLSSFHDPVPYGLAKSFLSSGNNATGIVKNIAEELEKQLEFLKKIRPNAKKIGVFGKGFGISAIGGEFLSALKQRAPQLGYEVVEYTTNVPPPKAEEAFHALATTIKPGDIDALYQIPGHYYEHEEIGVSELATRLKIPMVAPVEDLPNGGHFGYSGSYEVAGKQSANMVDKIFRGTKPSDIPLEYINKLSLVLYPVRAATADVVFPESIRSIADSIINDQ